ncbi:hypothetical protein MYSTI_06880 [Myxococcus stipitatus DSM 14675]|uniref:Uncharacterized protein n=1 Tax=Myxococcus stipitatus (strain DSM 14675 / JCM 12634 / Mx s8) TaxID=1278073 RepID=L7UJG9_MYXSD|nr:hypothetical protein MYSTI_06880 [Myxococcus stipitatus DSM 14675]
MADATLPLRQAEAQLAQALRKVYEAHAARGEAGRRREHLRDMAANLHSAARLLAQVPTQDPGGLAELALLEQAMKAVIRSVGESFAIEGGTQDVHVASSEPPRASLREPRLLDSVREILLPAIPLPELPEPAAPPPPPPPAPPPVTTLAQLDALLAKAQARLAAFESAEDKPLAPAPEAGTPPITDEEALSFHFGDLKHEEELLLGHARTCLEDLGMFGLLRRARPLTTWRNSERTEQRLLRRVDAIIACGVQVLPRLVKVLEERPEPDVELTWAHVFLFCSQAGNDSLDQALRIIRTVDLREPRMAEAVADALALAPHPGIERAVRPWLSAEQAAQRAVGLRILSRRRALLAADVERGLGDSELDVVRAASQGLGAAQGSVPPEVLDTALRHEDEEVVRAALEGALLRRSTLGLERARSLTRNGRGGFADAAMFLAVATDASGAEDFRAAMAAHPAPAVLSALGWLGDVSFVEMLLEHLAGKEAATQVAALGALQRLTGASLTDQAPPPEYSREEQPFLCPFVEPQPVAELSEKASLWSAWWAKHGRNAKSGTRYRFGHPWSPKTSLWELESPTSVPAPRRWVHVELAVRTGGDIPLEREDFVVRQLRQLEAWKAHVESGLRRNKAEGWATRYAR